MRSSRSKTRAGKKKPPAARGKNCYDVIVVGAGPAGSVLAWQLARAGTKVALLDRASFPRDKVCGDYVEPRGLRLLEQMGCLKKLEEDSPLPITHTATYVDSRRLYSGRIPFYGLHQDLPPHGYIVSRHSLDHVLLKTAMEAGAEVHQESYATEVRTKTSGLEVHATTKHGEEIFPGRLVVGADGTDSVVARSAGLLVADPRHIAVSQRAYADGYEGDVGEAAFFFDRDCSPGYGWVFPMGQGRVNLGVGILLETCQRERIQVPGLFRRFLDKVGKSHARCRKLRLCGPPVGGIVKTYGGAGPNYFHRGLLIGDAGCFVDPMTGEGITPAMESSLIAARVIRKAIQADRFDSNFLCRYETAYRGYFDPSMVFLDWCAATLRNKHFCELWNRALARGCERARKDMDFARTTGARFGGLEIKPFGILSQVWASMAVDILAAVPQSILGLTGEQGRTGAFTVPEGLSWIAAWWKSFGSDPWWHAAWTLQVQEKWVRVLSQIAAAGGDPRVKGLAPF